MSRFQILHIIIFVILPFLRKIMEPSNLRKFKNHWFSNFHLCKFAFFLTFISFNKTYTYWIPTSMFFKGFHSSELLKTCVHYFLFFSPNHSPKNYEKYLFHLKSYFCSPGIQTFVFLLPLFFLSTIAFEDDVR